MHRSDGYLENEVMTASPHRLHQMVLDAAIRQARAALVAFESQDREAAHFALGKCRDCVSELIGGLDPAHDPEMVESVKAIFVFAFRKCAEADAQHDPQLVSDAIRVLELHRETWIELGRCLPRDDAPPVADENGVRSWSA